MVSRQRFTKADRLRKRQAFLFLSRNGRRIHTSFFLALFVPAAERSRLGITVSKRVGTAVQRNRVKRLARETFRRNRHRLRGRWDINIIAKNGAAGLTTPEVFEQLQNLLGRISGSDSH